MLLRKSGDTILVMEVCVVSAADHPLQTLDERHVAKRPAGATVLAQNANLFLAQGAIGNRKGDGHQIWGR